MPFDSNGNYTLPTSYFVQNGDTVLPIQHNPPFEDVAQALSSVLPRSGVAPMNGDLKMGGKKVTNMADGAAATDAVTKGQLDAVSDVANKKANKAGDTFTGDMLFGPGPAGKYAKIMANGDVMLNRGDNTGYLQWNAPNAYFGWNGTDWTYGPGGKLFTAGGGVAVTNAAGAGVEYSYTGDHTFYGPMATEFGPSLSTALRGYTSAQQTWSLSSALVLAHGLGIIPKNIICMFVVKQAQSGFAVGDRLIIPATAARDNNYTSGEGFGIQVDATNVRIMFGSDGINNAGKNGGSGGRFGPAFADIVVIARL